MPFPYGRPCRVLLRGAVAVVLLGAVLSGCTSATESYCSDLDANKSTFKKLGGEGQSLAAYEESLEVFDGLAAAAPRDVADEWETFVISWQGLVDALRVADVDPATIKNGKPPDGVDETQFAAIEQAAEKLRSTAVVQSAQSIEQHAADVCKVELRESGLTG